MRSGLVLMKESQYCIVKCYFLENVETKRYVFQDGAKVRGNNGSEGGWLL